MKNLFRKIAIGGGLIALFSMTVLFVSLAITPSVTTYAQGEIVMVTPQTPILDRIADAESGGCKPGQGHQFNSNGTPVTHVNKDGSVDVGKYQINLSVSHLNEMTKLGFNPLTEEGNTAYAKWLYANRGTMDWQASAGCWAK